MMSWHCSNCDINWSPHQATQGCPVCGSGVHRVHGQPSPDTVPRFLKARQVAEDKADAAALAARWTEYAQAWDAEVLAAEALEFLRTVA